MTNETIIFLESQKLAKAGIIGYTGRTFKMVQADGTETVYKETEPIHTFKEWKSYGYNVIKGQHAIAKFAIWNFTEKASKETQAARKECGENPEGPDPHFYMKESAFFSASQVAPIEGSDK